MRPSIAFLALLPACQIVAADPCERISTEPLERWFRAAKSTSEPPASSGYVILAGNKSAHAHNLRCLLQEEARGGSELRHLSSPAAWNDLSCAEGCPSLLDDMARMVQARDGQWAVMLVHDSERAPKAQLDALATRFFQTSLCSHATADARLKADCRRVLFVLSTGWGADALGHPEARSRPRHALLSAAAAEATPWLSAIGLTARKRLRTSMAVILGQDSADRFAALMRTQDAERRQRREDQQQRAASAVSGGGAVADAGRRPDLTVFDVVEGQQDVVRQMRSRLSVLASGADGGESAHAFFFYGFPGTGKTFLAELVALAQHGRTSSPSYQVFPMQNYKTEEAMWNLISPPCGVKGEGAFANLFASRVGCMAGHTKGGGCGGAGPVVLFDEIEEARPDFMTSALVNALDKKGYVEFNRKDPSSDTCINEKGSTAGAFIILTSNCFMDELSAVLAAERRPDRNPAEYYEAVRKAMNIKIFDERIPCDASGKASPFTEHKMRDRMRGNVYPFLPLTEDQVVRAFEHQLHERAAVYESSRGVGLYWTQAFAQLIVDRESVANAERMQAVGPGSAAARAGVVRATGQRSGASANDGREVASLRKRLDELMRLDDRSVERLYADSVEACASGGGELARLVLHVEDGDPAAVPSCTNGTGTGTGSVATGRLSPSASVAKVQGYGGGVSGSGGGGGGDSASSQPQRFAVDVDGDVSSFVGVGRVAAVHAEGSTAVLTDREAALQAQVAQLTDKVAELQASLLRWQALSAALALVALALTMGLGQLLVAYSAMLLKAAVGATAIAGVLGVVAYGALEFLCRGGTQWACSMQYLVLQAARWAWWALKWTWSLAAAVLGGRWGWLVASFAALYVWALRRHRHQAATERQRLATAEREVQTSRAREAALKDELLQLRASIAEKEAAEAEAKRSSAAAAMTASTASATAAKTTCPTPGQSSSPEAQPVPSLACESVDGGAEPSAVKLKGHTNASTSAPRAVSAESVHGARPPSPPLPRDEHVLQART
jgi:hypothetical protein